MRRETTVRLVEGVATTQGLYGQGLYGSGTYGQTPQAAVVPSYRLVAVPLDETASGLS
ncbi:MAG: hypothetical protein RL134_2551 [Actinomycetota bacterium]|jgi:hypothetical protein